MDDEPDFLISFNDTLTCGFGASLLLFFVFAVLVIFEDVPSGDAQSAQSESFSRGFATDPEALASRAQLYIRLASSEQNFIDNISVPQPDSWMIKTVSLSSIKNLSRKIYVKTFRIERARKRYDFTVPNNTPPGAEYWISAFIGGTSLTSLPAVKKIYRGGELVFTLNLAAATPLVIPEI